MAVLHLLRHAKSDWGNFGLTDHDRPLAPRGERAAVLMGAYLQQEGIAPDLVLCSSALRVAQTWARIAPFVPEGTEVQVQPAIYGAGAMELLALARSVGDGIDHLMMVGHNPGTAFLAAHLCASGAPEELRAMRQKYPTAGLCSIEFDGPFSTLAAGDGTLLRFVTPKKLV